MFRLMHATNPRVFTPVSGKSRGDTARRTSSTSTEGKSSTSKEGKLKTSKEGKSSTPRGGKQKKKRSAIGASFRSTTAEDLFQEIDFPKLCEIILAPHPERELEDTSLDIAPAGQRDKPRDFHDVATAMTKLLSRFGCPIKDYDLRHYLGGKVISNMTWEAIMVEDPRPEGLREGSYPYNPDFPMEGMDWLEFLSEYSSWLDIQPDDMVPARSWRIKSSSAARRNFPDC